MFQNLRAALQTTLTLLARRRCPVGGKSISIFHGLEVQLVAVNELEPRL